MSIRTQQLPRSLTRAGVRAQRTTLLVTSAVALVIASMGPLAVLLSENRIRTMDLMSDPAELTGAPWYLGAVNSVNMFIWVAGAAVHLVAGAGLRQRSPRLGKALIGLGGLTVIFAFDDQFLLHEIFIPWIFGLHEIVTFALYAAVLTFLLVHFREILLQQPEASILMLALIALGASLTLDLLGWDLAGRRPIEEGLKLLGATAWAAFPIRIVLRWLSLPFTSPDAGAG